MMTLTIAITTGMDDMKIAKDLRKRKQPMKVGDAVYHVIQQAALQGRLRRGILECSRVLHRYPNQVMLCILETSVGPDNKLQHTLIEAFCREHGLKLVKVDSCRALTSNSAMTYPEQETTDDCDMDTKSRCSQPSSATKDENYKKRNAPVDTLETRFVKKTGGQTQSGLNSEVGGQPQEQDDSAKAIRSYTPKEKGCFGSYAHAHDSNESCILILKPDVLSKEDEFVLAFHDISMYCSFVQFPSIRLPNRN